MIGEHFRSATEYYVVLKKVHNLRVRVQHEALETLTRLGPTWTPDLAGSPGSLLGGQPRSFLPGQVSFELSTPPTHQTPTKLLLLAAIASQPISRHRVEHQNFWPRYSPKRQSYSDNQLLRLRVLRGQAGHYNQEVVSSIIRHAAISAPHGLKATHRD